jgi:cation transport ATPase
MDTFRNFLLDSVLASVGNNNLNSFLNWVVNIMIFRIILVAGLVGFSIYKLTILFLKKEKIAKNKVLLIATYVIEFLVAFGLFYLVSLEFYNQALLLIILLVNLGLMIRKIVQKRKFSIKNNGWLLEFIIILISLLAFYIGWSMYAPLNPFKPF